MKSLRFLSLALLTTIAISSNVHAYNFRTCQEVAYGFCDYIFDGGAAESCKVAADIFCAMTSKPGSCSSTSPECHA